MKILVIRTDRIGEVLLSAPILTALKEKWPEARISMMVRSEVRGLVEDNPNIDEIIEYPVSLDRRDILVPHNGGVRKPRLSKMLKEKDFDIAVIVNPKKEFHLATFLAGIPVRVGFDRKWGFLLTHKVKDLKSLAQRHEVEYNLDLVRALGIEPREKRPVLVVKDDLRDCFAMTATERPQPLIAIHPCTSNPKKQWPIGNFAKLGDLLIEKGYNIVMISGPDEASLVADVISVMRNKPIQRDGLSYPDRKGPINLAGKLTLKELATLLKRCRYLVSGDSGPVHIAAAVGTPVVALFGREDPGSRPKRWGPYGEGHIIIEKDRLVDIAPEAVLKVIPA